jgi:hypothetical protein
MFYVSLSLFFIKPFTLPLRQGGTTFRQSRTTYRPTILLLSFAFAVCTISHSQDIANACSAASDTCEQVTAPDAAHQQPAGDAAEMVAKKLKAQFVPTTFRGNHGIMTDIISPGSIVALQKDGLLVFLPPVSARPVSTYKKGKLSQGFGDAFGECLANSAGRPGGCGSIPQRTLKAGEKFWISAVVVSKNSIVLVAVTDPYDEGRYIGEIKFPFEKGHLPAPDEAVKMISEVLAVQQTVPDQAAPSASAPKPAVAQREVAMPEIAPPPPPSDATPDPPRTISLGQNKDQVLDILGPPQKVVHLGVKEIDYYSDLKVTFVSGKVTDVQ